MNRGFLENIRRFLPNKIEDAIRKRYESALHIKRSLKSNFPVIVRPNISVQGIKFKRPLLSGVVTDGNHVKVNEIWMAQLLKQLSIKDKIFLDIGANIGQTLLSLKSVYPDASYVGFEPNSACVFYINKLIKKNSLVNAKIIPVGISSKNDLASLWISKKHMTGSGATFKNIKTLRKKAPVFVPVFKLDDILHDITQGKSVGMIKIDVEGCEPEVIQGAVTIIEEHQPFLIIEFIPLRNVGDKERVQVRNDLQEILDKIGYNLFKIETFKNNHFSHLEKINSLPNTPAQKGDAYYSRDYLLVSSECLDDIRHLYKN